MFFRWPGPCCHGPPLGEHLPWGTGRVEDAAPLPLPSMCGAFWTPPWTLFLMGGLSIQLPGRDDTCRHGESFPKVCFGEFSQLCGSVQVSCLHATTRAGYWTLCKKQAETPAILWAFGEWQRQCWWLRREGLCWAQPTPDLWSLGIPSSKTHPSDFHLLPPSWWHCICKMFMWSLHMLVFSK